MAGVLVTFPVVDQAARVWLPYPAAAMNRAAVGDGSARTDQDSSSRRDVTCQSLIKSWLAEEVDAG